METLPSQFDGALSRIEINAARRGRAIAAHEDVRTLLETSPTLRALGIDTVLIGSYARQTSISPGRDVDVFCKLTALDTSVAPSDVFDDFASVLTDHYHERAEERARSVKIDFGGEFSVDAVPAANADPHWAIPAHERSIWGGEGRWITTDPEELGRLTTAANDSLLIGGQGAYVPLVKLMRQTGRHHRGDARPGGLYIELATYDVIDKRMRVDSFAELFAHTLRRVGSRLGRANTEPLLDPALGTMYETQPDERAVSALASLFSGLAEKAEEALESDRCRAAMLWREILGDNDRGRVFPIPEGCDETGRAVPAIASNPSRGSNEARAFGSAQYA
jgi:hypothetical protein